MRIHLLGAPRFEVHGDRWRFVAPPRTIPLLAYLIVAKRPVPRETAAAAIWPDVDDTEARANLRRHLHHLQRALPSDCGPWIATGTEGICWNESAAWIDVASFEAAHEGGDCAAATEIYGGGFLEGYCDDWILAHRERLCGAYLDDLTQLLARARSSRDHNAAVGYAQRILDLDEWREDIVRALMTVRFESGDRAGALGAFERFARRLGEEMRIDPMPETLALRDAIVRNAPLTPAQRPATGRTAAAKAASFVGRRREMAWLTDLWRGVDRSEGCVSFVSGEAGIGKTRLAHEFALHVEREGGRVLTGGTSDTEAAPYESLAEALRGGARYLVEGKPDQFWLRIVASIVPEVQPYLTGTAQAERLGDAAERTRLFEAIAHGVIAVARQRPAAIILEDLHWAGDATLSALEFLARRIGAAPVIVVATYRDEVENARLDQIRRVLQHERRGMHLRLGRLSPEEIDDLLASMRLDKAGPEIGAAVYRISEGNPLFALQVEREFAETGMLPSADDRTDLADIITARMRNLPEQAKALAEYAAVAGRSYSLDVLRDATGWHEDVLLTALYELMDRHIVRASFEQPLYEYAFSHNLIQNAIYQSIPERTRTRLHGRMAQIFERADSQGSLAAEVAVHFERAGNAERASDAYLRAAQRALGIYANEDAWRFAQRSRALDDARNGFEALRVAVVADERRGDKQAWENDGAALLQAAANEGVESRFEALECSVRRCDAAADREGERALLQRMRELAGNDPGLKVRVLAAEGRARMHCGDTNAAIALLKHGLHITEALGDPSLLLKTRIALAQALLHAGDLDEAESHLDRAEEELDPAAPVHDRLALERAFGSSAMGREDGPRLERVALRQQELAHRVGDVTSEAHAEMLLGYAAAYQQFDLERMREHWSKAAETFERIGTWQSYAITLLDLAGAEIALGRFEVAERNLDRAEEICERAGWRSGLAYGALNRAQIHQEQGSYEAARELAARAVELAKSTDERRVWSSALTVLGSVELALGDSAQGLEHLREGVEFRRSVQAPWSLGEDLCVLIEGLLQAGDIRSAADAEPELVELLETTPQQNPARICWILARLHLAQGHEDMYYVMARRAKAELEARYARLRDETLREAFCRHPLWVQVHATTASAAPSGKNARGTRIAHRSS